MISHLSFAGSDGTGVGSIVLVRRRQLALLALLITDDVSLSTPPSLSLRDNVFGDVSFGTLTGDGVTTTVVSSSQPTSSASSQPIATSTSNGPPSSSDINTAVIVGGIVGGLGTFAVAGLVALYFLLRRRRGRDSGRAGADAETKSEEDGSAANAFSHVESSGAEVISPLTLSNSSLLVPVTNYSFPGGESFSRRTFSSSRLTLDSLLLAFLSLSFLLFSPCSPSFPILGDAGRCRDPGTRRRISSRTRPSRLPRP